MELLPLGETLSASASSFGISPAASAVPEADGFEASLSRLPMEPAVAPTAARGTEPEAAFIALGVAVMELHAGAQPDL